MTKATHSEFGKWRDFFWPIHHYELKKLLPMFLMFFFISFTYSILRNTKDALLITASNSGAEVIPYLKVGGVVPAAFLFMLIYMKLSNILTKEKLFYFTLSPFIFFFILFATVLYPERHNLQPTELADKLELALPDGFAGLITVFRHWVYSLFYIFAELWGNFIFSLLFWSFANDIVHITEAKRFYALFGIGANLGLIVAGPFINYIISAEVNSDLAGDPWQFLLNRLIGVSVISGILVLFIYRWMHKKVLTTPEQKSDPVKDDNNNPGKKETLKMSIKDSFKFLLRSPYMLYILILVLANNISINFLEVVWKNHLRLLYPTKSQYLDFMGSYSTILGATTIFTMFFISHNVLKKFGWAATAYITPIVLCITGLGFLMFIIFADSLSPTLLAWNISPLLIPVFLGTLQNIMSKTAKFSLFDPTKEMAYIPLDPESKIKGKAAIDTLGARMGKASGSGILLFLIIMVGSLSAATPYIAIIMIFIIAAWIWAIKNLEVLLRKQSGAADF